MSLLLLGADAAFFDYVQMIDKSWENSLSFFNSHKILVDKYLQYRDGIMSKDDLHDFVKQFCRDNRSEIMDIVGNVFSELPCILLDEMNKNIYRKMLRMRELEIEKHILPEADLNDNIETSIKSAVYMNYRYLYNIVSDNDKLHCALFFFIRNYAYSGMFRYSSKGEFNVPYGGIAYNSKLMKKKLDYNIIFWTITILQKKAISLLR